MIYDDIDGNCRYTSGTDTIIGEYAYDANGRRISKTVGSAVTKYAYAGGRVAMEYDGSGQKLRKFIYGPGIDEPIAMITYAGDVEDGRYFYHGVYPRAGGERPRHRGCSFTIQYN